MDTVEFVAAVRVNIVEPTASFWTDVELLQLINDCIGDLWRAITDNYQDYFFTVSETPVQAVNGTTITGVPTDVAKVLLIEPVLRSTYPDLNYFPRSYNHPDFIGARAQAAIDPTQVGRGFYAITGAGAPVGAPTIHVAPKFTSAVTLRIAYTPTTPKLALSGSAENPIPGESDAAIIDYVTAYALAKQRPDRKPDPDWLKRFEIKRERILTFLTPRQNDEPDVAEAIFEPWTDGE